MKKIILGLVGAFGLLLICIVTHEIGQAVGWWPDVLKIDSKVFYPPLTVVMFAVFGWLYSAEVATHNARKQHTINTLLQSRLSAAFQQRMGDYDKHYPPLPTRAPIAVGDWVVPEKQAGVSAAQYFLNYYEFIAVGVLSGDLDANLLRATSRGIVVALVIANRELIKHFRKDNKRVYENLLRIYEEWRDESDPARSMISK